MKIHGLAILLGVGCSFPTPSEQYTCVTTADCDSPRVCEQGFCTLATNPDGAVDVATDTGPRFACDGWAPRHFDACMIPQPTGPLALSATGVYLYDTTDGSLTDPLGTVTSPPNALATAGRIVSVDAFELGALSTLRVIGTRPLVIAAWTTIAIAGTVDAGSLTTSNSNGAGANPMDCALHAAIAGGNSGNGAGGAGGGGFAGPGGPGGQGDAAGGGAGGTTVAAPLLLGGCMGATGGTGDAPGGIGGAGGGALQLTAQMGVTIAATGKLGAGGAGGKGAPANGGADAQGGGGGGGTGGMIGLQGATITIEAAAVLAANGGGGGGGASQGVGAPGADGALSAVRAIGGQGGNNGGGVGGRGGAGATLNGAIGGNSTAWGGGGGGGSVGFVVFTSASPATIANGAVISPAPTIVAP